MKIKQFVVFVTCVFVFSCKQQPLTTSKIEGVQINIHDSITAVKEIEDFVKPYREHIEKSLDSTLCYSISTLSKNDGELNTAIGNLMADIVFEQTNPILESRTGNLLDMVMLNHGGIRAIISKGNITTRTAYEVMPFENKIVVLELTAEKIMELVNYLATSRRAHPISGIQLTLNNDYSVNNVLVQGKPIDKNKTYFVATSDYLMNGGDRMNFFKNAESVTEIDYLIRKAMIDYFTKVDTINPVIDNRFIKLN
jgi:2',3'-cyclic-nucleotide 2'-phosphodiesterase (5'-nucleotidase family)